MAKTYNLSAEKRERAGKGVARSLRREGRVPAVIYGDKKDPVKISLDGNEVNVEYYKGHMFTTLCALGVDGKNHQVLARDVQLHPVRDTVEHVDFLRVNKKTKLSVSIPVFFTNEDKCPSLDQKGTVNIVRHTIELMCSAVNIPDYVEVSLEGKEHGDVIHLGDVELPEGAQLVNNPELALATLVPPKTAEELLEDLEGGADESESEAEEDSESEGEEEAQEE
ncbi:MAG: 50S ribosomal protein L25/general stress protein Ctc [Alphaproteobacteria bacterium]